MISKEELLKVTEASIRNLIEAFKRAPYTFYTESDLHCYVYNQTYSMLPAEKWKCVTPVGESILIHKEYPTKDRYCRKSLTEGLEKGSRGHFDLTIWNPEKTRERLFRANGETFEKEQQTFIAIEFDLKENNAEVLSAFHHFKWDLMKLKSTKNEVENGYLLVFGRNWVYEREFLDMARQFAAMEEKIVILYVNNSVGHNILRLSANSFVLG